MPSIGFAEHFRNGYIFGDSLHAPAVAQSYLTPISEISVRFIYATAALCSVLIFGTCHAAPIDCGKPPPLANEQFKAEVQGNAQTVGKLGAVGLGGAVTTSRNEILSKYPHADRVVLDMYFAYQFCSVIVNNPALTPDQKLDRILTARRALAVPTSGANRPASKSARPKATSRATSSNSGATSAFGNGKVLVRVDLQDPFAFGGGQDVQAKILLINNSAGSVVIRDIRMLVVDYRDNDGHERHEEARLRDVLDRSGAKLQTTMELLGDRMKVGNAGDFVAIYAPISLTSAGAAVMGPFESTNNHIVQLDASFRLAPIDRRLSNTVAGALVFDLIALDGSIVRRICPSFFNTWLGYPDAPHGTIAGWLGHQPLELFPGTKGGAYCEAARVS
jgi:hypothetical protein